MQDLYVGDIGDFGKYGLLRRINKSNLRLAVNWYKVSPQKASKQNDGKYIEYLSCPNQYRHYDIELFDSLYRIVIEEDRTISRIEHSHLLDVVFYSDILTNERSAWHQKALIKTRCADVVFPSKKVLPPIGKILLAAFLWDRIFLRNSFFYINPIDKTRYCL